MSEITTVLVFLNKYDLPNWLVAFAWPLFLYWWYNRRVSGVSGFDVFLSGGSAKMVNQPCDALLFRFVNNTGSVVYLTNLRLFTGSKPLVHPMADKNLSDESYELKLLNSSSNAFELRQITIQTNDSVSSFIPLSAPPPQELFPFKTPKWRQTLGFPVFFRLEYTVVVANDRYKVSTIY